MFIMDWGAAAKLLKKGKKIARKCWGDGTYLRLWNPYNDAEIGVIESGSADKTIFMPMILLCYDDKLNAWMPTYGELLAEDWGVYEEANLAITVSIAKEISQLYGMMAKMNGIFPCLSSNDPEFQMKVTKHFPGNKADYHNSWVVGWHQIDTNDNKKWITILTDFISNMQIVINDYPMVGAVIKDYRNDLNGDQAVASFNAFQTTHPNKTDDTYVPDFLKAAINLIIHAK